MRDLFQHLKDRLTGKAPKGARRSPQWREVRQRHLEKEPYCQFCGSDTKLEVHHILPFHLFPSEELEPSNLVTLCRGSGRHGLKSCHRAFGHLGDWKNFNLTVREDCDVWFKRFNGDKNT